MSELDTLDPDSLAALLATDDGLARARSRQTEQPLPWPVSHGTSTSQLLDWHPVEGDPTTLRRPRALPCKPRELTRKHPGVTRVCLFGESMAAGFPLAPAYTPALVLAAILEASAQGTGSTLEVIDLSKANMGPSEQLTVIERAMALQPDHCVFMGGNNWYYGLSVEPTAHPIARVRYAQALSEGGPHRLASEFRQQLTQRAETMVEAMLEWTQTAGAHAIFVPPPANHTWSRRCPVPWLDGDASAQWHKHFHRAQAALIAGDADAVFSESRALSSLGDDLTGIPETLASRAHRLRGESLKARDAARAAMDAANWQSMSWALPQAPTAVCEALRRAARAPHASLVDLEDAFTRHTGSPLHDARLFYDQCHLTEEAIRVAMTAVAGAILAPRDGETGHEPTCSTAAPEASPILRCAAALRAAHWTSRFFAPMTRGEDEALIHHWLEVAQQHHPAAHAAMDDLIELRSAPDAQDLHAALRRAARIPGLTDTLSSSWIAPNLLRTALQRPRSHDEDPTPILACHQQRLRRDGLDLSHPRQRTWYWEHTPLANQDRHERQGAPLYQASWPESHFSFLTDGTDDLELTLVTRCQDAGELSIDLDGQPIGRTTATRDWSRHQLRLPRVAPGLHTLSLSWPELSRDGAPARDAAVRALRIGAPGELFPMFGEVYTLVLRSTP